MNFFLFLYFIPIASGFTETQKLITKSLIDHFQIKHCILAINTENKLSAFSDFKLMSEWKIISNVKSPKELYYYLNQYLYPMISMGVIGTNSTFWEKTKKLLMPKTLVIFQNSNIDSIIQLFYPYKKSQTAGYFTWVAFLEESEKKFLSKVRVPYNTEFIVIIKENATMYKLNEIYLIRETPFLINFGTWDEQKGFREDRPMLSFYERRLNMNNTLLYAYKFRENSDKVLNSYHLEILQDFGKMMNTSIEISNTAPYLEITISDLVFGMSDSTYTKDNVGPILKVNSYLYIKEPNITTSNIYFLLPFTYNFWFALISFIIQTTIVNILLHLIFRNKYSEENIKLIDSIFKTLETLCNQSGGNESKLYTSRVIAYKTSLFFIIVVSAFSAVLQSHLTVRIPPPPFQNFDELLQDKSYSVGTHYDGYDKLYFQYNLNPYHQRIYKILSKDFVRSIKDGFRRACKEKHAQVAYEYDFRSTQVNCKLYKIQEPVITRLSAIRFFVHSNGINKVFAYKLHWFYSSGIIHKIQNDLKGFQMEALSINYFPVEITQIPLVMAIIIAGVFVSFIMFVIELGLPCYETLKKRLIGKKLVLPIKNTDQASALK